MPGIVDSGFGSDIYATDAEPVPAGQTTELALGVSFRARQVYTGPNGAMLNSVRVYPRKGGAGNFGPVAAGNLFQLVIISIPYQLDGTKVTLTNAADFKQLQGGQIYYNRSHDPASPVELIDLGIVVPAQLWLNVICLPPQIAASGLALVGGAFYEINVLGRAFDNPTDKAYTLR